MKKQRTTGGTKELTITVNKVREDACLASSLPYSYELAICPNELTTTFTIVNGYCPITRTYKKFFPEKNATLPLALCLWGLRRWHYGGISGIFGRYLESKRVTNKANLEMAA